MTVIDNPASHSMLHFAQCISMLRIEVRTGMKHSRGSVLALVRERYGIKSRTKAGALAEMLSIYEEVTGHPYGRR